MQRRLTMNFPKKQSRNKGGQQSDGEPKNPMTKEDAARIQRSYAKQHGGKVDKGSSGRCSQARKQEQRRWNRTVWW